MANVKTKRHKNALKALRKSLKRQSENRGIKVRIHKKIKEFKKLLSHNNHEAANKMLPELYSIIDKAAKRNTIHWKNAARKKSELVALVKKSLNNQK
ncbi:MAG: 30S ribosomal protein S20 [Elusimicrobiales bacterium]|jgi:small subunit ribosomal protein S20|nr:30S ribosomal protein S20 [Elusimicrobiales bacterium]HOL63147.1 30S ribosomal protein S20 [Elusimicrobiales bacterium]HPO96229.1 30S ribosomal protein S20 [Elusimicrobiales bacterium]